MASERINIQSSRDRIKSRMMRNASQIWGQPNVSEESFDPLVGMLIGACSMEIEKIYNDLQTSQARVLERLSHLLTPEVLGGAKAAHAILHARSIEPTVELAKEFQFVIQKKIPQKDGVSREEFGQLFFTPVHPVKLFDAEVKMMVHGGSIFSTNAILQKEKIADSRSGKKFQPNVLYLGLEVNRRIENFEHLSFYFDWINNPDKNQYAQLLSLTRWYLGEKNISISHGLPKSPASNGGITDFEIELENDQARIEEKNISNLYQSRFVTLNDRSNTDFISIAEPFPKVFKEVFSEHEIHLFKESLVWLKVEFPASSNVEILQDLSCCINAFPIVNRRRNEFAFRLQSHTNIIPLSIEGEHFYSVCSVRISDGSLYVHNISKDFSRSKSGSYILRQGGVERFDKRSASQMLSYLIDLLRDESAAFAVYGNEMISSNLKELNQMLKNLIQRVEHGNVSEEQVTYLIVKPRVEAENIFVEFWSTHGEFANMVRTGSQLMPYAGYEVKPDSVLMLTNSVGGQDNLSGSEMLNSCRKALMTRGRIVTPNDIRVMIRQELGEAAANIEITRGIMNSVNRKEAFVRTIDVLITPSASDRATDEEWSARCLYLESVIRSDSSGFYPIRIRLKKG
ncbi:MAG: type VI secretion system baseplate subunit TssF [Crocinitomicaceae bacterium]|nr:type VI secretion system baseplate subunit TssF [Crocinitomicaceae bacterium]